jgi:hypothetical protein
LDFQTVRLPDLKANDFRLWASNANCAPSACEQPGFNFMSPLWVAIWTWPRRILITMLASSRQLMLIADWFGCGGGCAAAGGCLWKHRCSFMRELMVFPSGKHEALWSSELDQADVDGKPHNSSGSTLTHGVMHRGDEPTKRQRLFTATGFHGRKYRLENRPVAMGCSPHVP